MMLYVKYSSVRLEKKKKLQLVKFWCSIKEYPQLSEKAITLLYQFAYLCEGGFSAHTSTKTTSYNRLNGEAMGESCLLMR